MNRVLDILARLPSTNLQVCASVVGFFMALTSALASYLAPMLDPIPEGPLLVIFGFVAATAVLVVAVLAELRGGLNKHPDDTWSEWVWSMIGGRPALLPVTIGFAAWLPWQFLELAPGGGSVVEAVGWDLGLGTLAAGTALTLILHFVFRGRFG